MSHRCAKVGDKGGVHYFCRLFGSFCSRTVWNTAVESYLKHESNDGFKKKSDNYSLRNRVRCFSESKSWRKAVCALSTVQYVHSNPRPHALLLTSCRLACKVQKLVLTLKLTQEPMNAMRPREVRLQKSQRGWGLTKSDESESLPVDFERKSVEQKSEFPTL